MCDLALAIFIHSFGKHKRECKTVSYLETFKSGCTLSMSSIHVEDGEPDLLREQPFDFYGGGGGAGRLRKKKFPALILGKKNSPARRAGKKNSLACLRKRFRTPKPVFALQIPPFAVRNLLSQSEICFRSLKSAFRTP